MSEPIDTSDFTPRELASIQMAGGETKIGGSGTQVSGAIVAALAFVAAIIAAVNLNLFVVVIASSAMVGGLLLLVIGWLIELTTTIRAAK